MDLGLKDKTALVLGAGGGLGSAIAATLAAEGAKVALGDIDAEAAARSAAASTATGGRAMALKIDLADIAALDGHVAKIEAELGPVDILVNNTGGPPPTPAAGQDVALWTKSFEQMV
ncbi:SDR family NAD(P)-dependent oxidoreductase, partial [Streptomyces sp. DH17]|nr:SDR family NAD(P)-dependent oxidoreductase [Streptomyces sp. DH17]